MSNVVHRKVLSFGAALALALAGCAPATSDAPLRSPSRDYPPPDPTTGDGEVVGADGMRPADKLEQGPSAGSENSLAPGWTADEHGLRHDPKQRAGGAVDQKPVKEP